MNLSSPRPSTASESLPSPSTSSTIPTSSANGQTCRSCSRSLVKILLCSRCKTAYCSAACQKKDWKLHKKTCRVYYPPSSSKDQEQVFPNEIFQKILEFVFLRPAPTTPSSDPYYLNGKTHLLLVSSVFRELALPLLYRSVTISRPSHYVKFFDPEKGLFVAGKDSKVRWGFVRELNIMSEVHPPPEVDSEDGDYIVPLAFPSFSSNLSQVCILEALTTLESAQRSEEETSWLNQPGAKQLLQRIQEDERERIDAEMALGERHREEGRVDKDGRLLTFDEWIMKFTPSGQLQTSIDESIAAVIEELLRNEQNGFFDDLIFAVAPRTLRVRFPCSKAIMEWCSPPQDCKEVETLAIHLDPSFQKAVFAPLYRFAQTVGSGSNISHVQLFGYPPEMLDRFVKWTRTRKPSENKDRIERWTWTTEDGTTFELKITENVWIRPRK